MSNILILFPNRVDKATISGGAWMPALPLANLQSRVLKRVARSSGVTAAATQFTVALAKPQNIRAMVLVAHSLTLAARVRWTASLTADFSTVVYDTGFVDVYPAVFTTETLEWEDENFWSGRPTEESVEGFTQSAITVLPSQRFAQFWKCEIRDPLNPAGYIQIGRVFLSGEYQPTYNYAFGASLGYEADTLIEKSVGGAEYFDRREPYRVMRFGFEYLPENEVFSQALDIQRRAGVDGEVFIIPDPDDTLNMLRRAFLGRLRALNPLEQVVIGRAGIQFEIKELL